LEAAAPELTSENSEAAKTDIVVTQAEADSVRDRSDLEQAANTSQVSALRAFLGIGSPYRSLAYHQPITSALGDYQLSGAPMADIHLAFQPARWLTDGWASWFGLDARAQITLSSLTLDRDGNQFKSRYDAYQIGLRARVPLARHAVSVFSGYAMNRLAISGQKPGTISPTPSVDYRSIRSGLGGELALSDAVMIGLDAAWLHFLSVGDIGRWFPRATAAGLELALCASYRMTAGTFARITAAYQRAFFAFNSRPGDKNIAGGATDQHLALSLGMGVNL
jgi:hypothetical protein